MSLMIVRQGAGETFGDYTRSVQWEVV